MRLFLTSSPCTEGAPDGVDLPFLWREENGFARRLMESLPAAGRAVMIAAWPEDHERNDRMAWEFAEATRFAGFGLSGMTMVDSRNGRQLPRLLQDCALVLLSGGHVPTQNRFFQRIGLREALRGFDGTVVGISAGTMNAASCVYAQPEEAGEALDPGFQRFLPGLGLTDFQILPHLNRERYSRVDGLRLFEDISIPDSAGHRFYALPDGSYILQEHGSALLCGEAWLLENASMTFLQPDGAESALPC